MIDQQIDHAPLTAELEAEARAEHVARADRAVKATLEELKQAAADLAEVQPIVDAFEAAKKDHAAAVLAKFNALGRPDESRSLDYTTIAQQTTFKRYNPLAALSWAKTQPGLEGMIVKTMVDQDALVSLMKTGVLKDVPAEVIQVEQKEVVRVQGKMIAALLLSEGESK